MNIFVICFKNFCVCALLCKIINIIRIFSLKISQVIISFFNKINDIIIVSIYSYCFFSNFVIIVEFWRFRYLCKIGSRLYDSKFVFVQIFWIFVTIIDFSHVDLKIFKKSYLLITKLILNRVFVYKLLLYVVVKKLKIFIFNNCKI